MSHPSDLSEPYESSMQNNAKDTFEQNQAEIRRPFWGTGKFSAKKNYLGTNFQY